MSSFDPPTFNTGIFNATAFIDTSEVLTLGNANKLYLEKISPSITSLLTITRPKSNEYMRWTDGTTICSTYINSGGIPSLGTISNHGFGFYTNDGTSNQFFLKVGGNVGLGTNNPNYQLELTTDSAAKPTSNTWTATSDERVKEDIEDANLDLCYNNIKNLKLKYYKWKDDFIENHLVEDKHKLGWIAQDVEKIIPKAVITTNNEKYNIEDFKSLNSDQIIACMFGAIQKLMLEFDEMKKFINSLNIEEE